MSLVNRTGYLDPSTVSQRDYWIAVGGGLAGTFIAGFELSAGVFPNPAGVAVVISSLFLAGVAFIDAYLTAAELDDEEASEVSS